MENGVIFDLEENEGDWFSFFESTIELTPGEITYDDPKPGTGKVRFRSPRKFLEDRIATRKKISEFVHNPKSRAMEKIESYKSLSADEAKKENEDRIDYVITGIEDFFGKDKKPITCTKENKVLLSRVPVFDRFIAKCMEIQANSAIKHEETITKNSGKP